MKDPDSSNKTVGDTTEDVEAMSLADLLDAAGSDDDAPKRVDKRDDEPGSGMVNLASMVAQSSVAVAQSPGSIPPGTVPPQVVPAMQTAPPPGSGVPAFAAVGAVAASPSAPYSPDLDYAPPVKKKNGIVIVALVLFACAGVGGAFALFQQGDDLAEDVGLEVTQNSATGANATELQAEIDKIKAEKEAKQAGVVAASKKEDEKEVAEDVKEDEEEEEEEAPEDEVKADKKKSKGKSSKRGSRKAKKSSKRSKS